MKRARAIRLGVLWLGTLIVAIPAAADPPLAYQIQAAYVAQFLRFVEWPAREADQRFVVGIVGGPEFIAAMDALDGSDIGDRSVGVRHVSAPEGVGQIDVLVIGPSVSRSQAARYLRAVGGRPILTVGDADGFVRAGGMIQFVPVKGRVRFQVNIDAADRAGLKLSSRLLRLARNVRQEGL